MTDYYQIEECGIVEDHIRGNHKKKWQNDIINILFFVFGFCFAFIAIVYNKVIINEWHNYPKVLSFLELLLDLAIFTASIAFIVASYELFLDRQSEVSITKHGLLVKYPMHKTKLLKWDEFYTVCLCIPEMAYSRTWDYEAICFVRKGEKPNMSGRWKTDNPLHMRRLICISNTDELLLATKEWCPIPVVDVRETVAYLKYR